MSRCAETLVIESPGPKESTSRAMLRKEKIDHEEAGRILDRWARSRSRIALLISVGSGSPPALTSQYLGKLHRSATGIYQHQSKDVWHQINLAGFAGIFSFGEKNGTTGLQLSNASGSTLTLIEVTDTLPLLRTLIQ